MGLAFIRFRKGVSFEFRWAYDEVFVVTQGSLTIRAGDEIITAEQGQFLHTPALVPLADMELEIRHVLAEGDLVVMHSRRWLPAGPTIAVVNIWRLDEGQITEAWEIIEPLAAATTNLTWWDPPRSA